MKINGCVLYSRSCLRTEPPLLVPEKQTAWKGEEEWLQRPQLEESGGLARGVQLCKRPCTFPACTSRGLQLSPFWRHPCILYAKPTSCWGRINQVLAERGITNTAALRSPSAPTLTNYHASPFGETHTQGKLQLGPLWKPSWTHRRTLHIKVPSPVSYGPACCPPHLVQAALSL